jgi:hypothetical protein
VLVGEPPEDFEFRTGSDTLRELPFVSWRGRPYLLVYISDEQAVLADLNYLGV